WPDVTPPGHTEQATPVGAPMRTPAEPWTMLPPYCVMSPCRFSAHLLILVLSGYLSASRQNPTDL
ncbi:TPA: hypothetical protein ACH52L_002929, partial [Escherichia coli]